MEIPNFTREELAQYILTIAKDSVIDQFKTILINEKNQDIVAHTVEGNPLTFLEYQNELEEAEKEIEKGDYLTSNELEKEIATWK